MGGHQSATQLLSGIHAVWALLSWPREESSPAQASRLPGRWVTGRTGCSVAAQVGVLTARAGHHQQKLRRVDVDVLDHRACDLALLTIGDGIAVVPLVVLAEVEDRLAKLKAARKAVGQDPAQISQPALLRRVG